MKILKKSLSSLIVLALLITMVPQMPVLPGAAAPAVQSSGAKSQSAVINSWADEISHNGSVAGTISVPPVIRVANAGYSLSNQAITPTDCTTIQTQLINYTSRTMQNYSTSISITVPSGATAPALTAATQGAGLITLVADNTSGNPYTWHISGGTASAGNYIDYKFTYNYNGHTYVQKAASYVDLVELPAGWQTYVVRRNFSDVTHTRHEYTALLAGSCSTGAGYAVYGSGGSGYYNMATGGGTSGFNTNPTAYSGMKIWNPGYDNRENCSIWYCGQPGKNGSDDNVDGGYRANLDVYYDPTVVTNISQLGIKMLYWRSTSPSQIATMYQEKMLYLLGNPLFSDGDSSNATARSYFYSTNAQSNRSQYLDSNPSTMVFNFASTALPPDGQKVTFASSIYGNYEQQVYLWTWDAWLITFHVVNKSALRTLISTEDTAFRQIWDGYSDADGSFTAYQNQLAKAKAVLNQPNATAAQITAAVNDLNTAKNNLKYVPADYSALNALVSQVYSPGTGYRPSPVNDPDYYYMGTDYYPSNYYISTTDLDSVIAGIEYGHDIRYQTYINAITSSLNIAWRDIVLKNADYTVINNLLGKIDGLNDETGSEAGNYIMANSSKYPQYANVMFYWRYFTDDSYAAWDSAVNCVTLGLKIPDQAQVSSASAALQTAYDNLTLKPADYSELDTVCSMASSAVNRKVIVQNPAGAGYEITYYDNASVNAMQTLMNSIVYNLYMPEQGTVYNWTDSLLSLYSAKKVNGADYTFANEQKSILAEYEASHSIYYTDASWQQLVNARNAVKSGKMANEQSTVNSWAQNIYAARNALVFNPADYSAVNAAITAANALPSADYQNWNIVQAAIGTVVPGLTINLQAQVDGYAAAINAAVSNLVLKNADTSTLLAAISSASAKDENLYTPASWAALGEAVDAGISILDADPAYTIYQQAAVDSAAGVIETRLAALVYRDADYAGVAAAIAAANALTPANYKNWASVQASIDSVVYNLNITKQSTVDGFAAAINTAVTGLIYNDADLSGLISSVSDAATYDESLYTPASWAVLSSAVAAGIAVRDADPAYTFLRQAEVDDAAAAITNAVAGLIYRDADLSGLESAIADAQALNESIYTPETWAVLQNAVAEAAAIRDASPAWNITKQAEVDTAVSAVSAAVAGLKEIVIEVTAAEGGTAAVDTARGFIYGLPADGSLTGLDSFLRINGGGHLVYTPTAAGFGTGTGVELIRDADGKVMATYTVVIFGDTTGDGVADGCDVCTASMIAAGMLGAADTGDAVYFAADANHDGVVNELDAQLIEQAGLFLADISQTV